MTGRALLERFARSHDPECLTARAVLDNVPQADTLVGRREISAFLRALLYEAFADARLVVRSVGLDEPTGLGVIEWTFSGRQIAPAFGVRSLGRELRLAIVAVCEVGPDGIAHVRIYYDAATVRRQLTSKEDTHG